MHEFDGLGGPLLVLTVGPAASGKSTLLGRLARAGVVDVVVSTDAIRAELELPADETDTAYAVARSRVGEALAEGRVAAVDATNVRVADRARWLAVAAAVGAPAAAVLVGVGLDLEQLLVRDKGRSRHVPAWVIADQLELARRSTPHVLRAEGFAVVALDRERLVWSPTAA